MSVTSKNSSHRRDDSGELVVFEAARYFSGSDDNPCYQNSSSARDGGVRAAAAARMSLDMPAINLSTIQKQYLMKEKKTFKHPSSPGARLATFLNSLFNHTNAKNKNKSKTTTAAAADDQRRSSISHFITTTSSAATNDYDSSAAVTPPSYAITPTKSSREDLKRFSDRQKAISENAILNERLRLNNGSFRNPKSTKWTADDEDQRQFEDGRDDGQDSDSSSDLFDLPNTDFYSSGLPVYGTTDLGRIRIGAPISTGATV